MKNKKTTLALLICFFLGLLLLLYPSLSQYWNSIRETEIIDNYEENIKKNISKEDNEKIFQDAYEYNYELSKLSYPLIQYKKLPNYTNLVNINGSGMMGYISINKIKVELPIYHTTKPEILSKSVGHLEGSSLPVGGESTHAILSAHRGLPSSKLFTDLSKLEIGDTFTITILDKVLTYQVDKISVVTPKDTTNLQIENGFDYVTLITCTPYGINTHRLLVRGTRIDNIIDYNRYITSDAYIINRLLVSICIAIPILLILVLYVMLKPSKNSKKEEL